MRAASANRDSNNAGTTGYGGAAGSYADGSGSYWSCLFVDNEIRCACHTPSPTTGW
jgi:hypothetical protein